MTLSRTDAALNRSIGLPQATAMVIGTIIGASVFVQPSEISRHVPSVRGMLLVWLLSGGLTFCGALVCAELASAFPLTGGVYVFLRETFSPAAGFLWGWAMFWSIHSGIIAAIAVVVGRYVGFFVPLGGAGIRVVAVVAILALSAINYLGVAQASRLQTFFTILKVSAIALLVTLLFSLGSPAAAHLSSGTSSEAVHPDRHEFVLALIAGLFAFGGWHMVTYAADETRTPVTTIPRALMLGTLVVTGCYLALNAAYLYVLPAERVRSSTRVAADAASVVMGPGGAAAISGLVILSAFGALSGIILAGPRVYFAMARDGLLFRWMGGVHPRFRTPHIAIVAQALWSSVLVATGTYRGLFTRVIYTEWIFFGTLAFGLFLLRRRVGYAPRFRTWGSPFVPLLFVISSAVIVFNQIIADPIESVTGLLLVGAGLPVYYLWARRRSTRGVTSHAGR